MADNPAIQFFSDAKAQLESVRKWCWVIVALLAYLQFVLVEPFIADTNAKASLDQQLAENQAAAKALKPVLEDAAKLAHRVDDEKNQVAEELKDNLVMRFKRLDEAIKALSGMGPTKAEGSEGEALFASRERQQQQQQQVQQDLSALPPMESSLRRRIAETASMPVPGELPAELQRYIQNSLIPPAFDHANETWLNFLNEEQASAKAIADDAMKAEAAAPMAKDQLVLLTRSIKALNENSQSLTFVAPPTPWWKSVAGKEDTIISMTSRLSSSVGNLNTDQAGLGALTTQIEEIVAKKKETTEALSTALDDLQKRAADLQSKLGDIGAPLKAVSFKLAEIVPLMPLTIAIALAAIAIWSADCLRRMSLASGLIDDDANRGVVRAWLRAAGGGSRAKTAVMATALTVLSAAWVLFAARDAFAFPSPFSFASEPMLVAIAVVIVVVARAIHWHAADRAVSAYR